MSLPVRVAIAAPHIVRSGVRSVLRTHSAKVTVLKAGDHDAAQVVMFDPLRRDAVTRRAFFAGVPLLAIVYDDSPAASAAAAAAGAVGVVHIGDRVSMIVCRIQQVAELAASRPADTGSGAAETGVDTTLDRGTTSAGIKLSGREEDVLRLICAGYSNQEICRELYVSINSVKTYIRSLYRKAGITSRPRAVRWGLDNGYADY